MTLGPRHPVFVVDACRTPIGRLGGMLAGTRPDDLTAVVVSALLRRTPSLDPAAIDEVVWGAANQAGEDNRNVARMGALLAGVPVDVPGVTVNRLCGSGLQAVICGAQAISAGEADVCLAGGTESMSRAPFVLPRATEPYPRAAEIHDTRLGWRMVNDRMRERYPPVPLGETAEKVASRYDVTRARQDELALASHRRAAQARSSARFAAELEPISVGDSVFSQDEGVRDDTSIEALGRLKPIFRSGGTVTAGNSSPLNDGSAGLLLMSADAVEAHGVEPLARYVTSAAAGVHPDLMGIGPVPATRKALGRAGWSVEELELVEINEAFAAQAVAVRDELGLAEERVNVNGGAIALGHPLGCSGARILTTLVHEMRRRGARRGLATMCIGVGQGVSALMEAG